MQDTLNQELFNQENNDFGICSEQDTQKVDKSVSYLDAKSDSTSIEDLCTEEEDFVDLPTESTVIRIIVRKGMVVEKVFKTSTGSNISVLF